MAIRNTIWNQRGVAYNPDTALARYARANELGAPYDNEQRLVIGGRTYVVQPFGGAILAVPEGEWDRVEEIGWN